MEYILSINRKILIDLVILPAIIFVVYVSVSQSSFKTIGVMAFNQETQTVGPKEQYVFERGWGRKASQTISSRFLTVLPLIYLGTYM